MSKFVFAYFFETLLPCYSVAMRDAVSKYGVGNWNKMCVCS